MAEKPNQQTPKGDGATPQTPQGTQGETPPKETPPAGVGTPPPKPAEKKEDFEKKFSDSTKENQRLEKEVIPEKNQKIADLEAQLASKEVGATLSDEELAQKHPDWDVMSDSEKTTARNAEEIRRMKEKQAWQAQLAEAIRWARDNQYNLDPVEFQTFCYKPENIGSKDILTLAKAFVFDQRKPAEPAPPANPGVEPPTGGQAPPDEGKMTKEKARQIRKTNPKLYKEMILDGRINAKDIT